MRRSFLLILALCGAAACSSSDGGSGTTGPGGPAATAYSLSADSVFLDRTAPIGTALTTSVNVALGGQPAANVTVNWIAAAGSGVVSTKTSTTDASGVASVIWTLSDTARVNMLTATAGTGSVNVTATTTAGNPFALAKGSPDSTLLVAGASTLLTVRVVDSFGNRVAGVPVSWTATGGSLSPSSSTTGANGNADVVFVSSGTPTTYSVTATAPGLTAVSYKIVGF